MNRKRKGLTQNISERDWIKFPDGSKPKRKMSAAGRKAISEAQKKRWAKKKSDGQAELMADWAKRQPAAEFMADPAPASAKLREQLNLNRTPLYPGTHTVFDSEVVRRRDVESETSKVQTGTTEAYSSKQSLYYHDVPPELYMRIAKRYSGGHVKYSPKITMNLNWRVGISDPLYVMDRLNHLFEHLIDFLRNGDRNDDNLAAIAWSCGFLMEVERLSPDTLNQVIYQDNLFGEVASEYKKTLELTQIHPNPPDQPPAPVKSSENARKQHPKRRKSISTTHSYDYGVRGYR